MKEGKMTLIDDSKNKHISEQIKNAAEYDSVSPDFIMNGLIDGTIVIPANKNHNFKSRAVGSGLTTKINLNLGTSENNVDIKEELKKLEIACKYGADSFMDLSTAGNLDEIRRELLAASSIMMGTVPIYSVISDLAAKDLDFSKMSADMLFEEIEKQAEQGVDFMTVHCGINYRSLDFLEKNPRLVGIVSRGGSMLKYWMKKNKQENPLYAQFDRLLKICAKHDVTISLGDGLRPGGLADATDQAQLAELMILGELVKQCKTANVQVMVEGPGHVPWKDIEMNINLQKSLCSKAPFYVLGPLTSDITAGYDHITGAIGATAAAVYGADFLCCVTPAEHLCLPNTDDIKQGVIAFKIAAHSADISKGIKKSVERDYNMSYARANLCWDEMYKYVIDPELAAQRKVSTSGEKNECSMCGRLCAVKVSRQ
jgi:phosphomethylpyrimidine synthase